MANMWPEAKGFGDKKLISVNRRGLLNLSKDAMLGGGRWYEMFDVR